MVNKTPKREQVFDEKNGFLNYSSYSPDLSPRNYILFPKLKTNVKGAFCDDISRKGNRRAEEHSYK